MRILVISHKYPPDFPGGMELRCETLVEELSSRGHKIKILARRTKRKYPNEADIERRLYYFYEEKSFLKSVRYAFLNYKIICTVAKQFNPDVIYVCGLTGLSTTFVLLALRKLQIPLVFAIDDHWLELSVKFRLFSPLAKERQTIWQHIIKYILSWTVFRFVRHGDFIIVSEMMKNKFIIGAGYPKEKFHLIYPFDIKIPDKLEEKRIDEAGVINLLFAGQVKEVKGVHVAIEALAELKRNSDKCFKLDIFGRLEEGEENYKQRLEGLIKKFCLEKDVKLKGFVPLKKMHESYKDYHVLLFTSLHLEPLGRVILEAMVNGVLVIASDKGGPLELIKDGVNGLLFSQGDSKDLAEKIKFLFSNTDCYLSMRENSYKSIRDRFSLEDYFNSTESVLKKAAVEQKW